MSATKTTCTTSSIPVLGRSGDALALAMWKQLMSRSAADRRVVFLALAGRLGPVSSLATVRGERAELASRSLLLCAHELGEAPSKRKYTRWRDVRPDRREWVSAGTIRNAFGSWTRALAACGLEPAPDVRGKALAAFGPRFTDAELIAALQAWDRETPDDNRSCESYHRYATRVRGDWALRGRRLPSRYSPFLRAFGSWSAALAAARLPTPEDTRVRGFRARGSRSEYTNERIERWLRLAGTELGIRRIGTVAYDEWAKNRCREALADGRVVAIARSNTIATRYGSWGQALLAAGQISETEAQRVAPDRPTCDRAEMLAAIAQAIREVGEDHGRVLTIAQYRQWRAGQPDKSGRKTGRPLPDSGLIRGHFDRWNHAVCAAITSDPELAKTFTTRPKEWSTRWDKR